MPSVRERRLRGKKKGGEGDLHCIVVKGGSLFMWTHTHNTQHTHLAHTQTPHIWESKKKKRRRRKGEEEEGEEEEGKLGLGEEEENSTHSLACKLVLFNSNFQVGNSLPKLY